MNRRGFLTGLSSLIAAPAIVRAGSLMPVRGIVMPVTSIEVVSPGSGYVAWTSHFAWNMADIQSQDWQYAIRLVNPRIA